MNLVQSLSRIRLICRDAEALRAFYQAAFGFAQIYETSMGGDALTSLLGIPGATARITGLRLGGQRIELACIQPQGEPYPADVAAWSPLFQHFAIVVSDMAAAFARLSAQTGWKSISTEGPQALPASSGGVIAYKFRDPEGHPLELIAFPSNAVPEQWQRSPANGFLGVDHSAISVAETSRSVEFYRRLGLQRAGGSWNTGSAQDRLDDVKGAVVEVTALAPLERTPHVELLCYHGDLDRHSISPGISDVASTQLVLLVESSAALDVLCAQNTDALFSGPVSFENGAARAIMRDPDGHWLCLEALH
ncbi:MAG: VOC family protein [Rhodomicrobium sp.]